ncbi:hypothetical protein, partial [uncultured Sphingorhabdus sp.]|uniref:hypothetical protein n=1 Tax=uncultured Sphingorhabdus sp. TaxID=1686106 RepID=UPI0026138224
MTVSTQYQPFTYKPGAAMAAEAIDWQFLAAEQLRVTHIAADTGVETVLVLGDDYAIGGSGPAGTGTITALAAWPVADDFRVERVTDLQQEYDIPPFESIHANGLEQEIDRQAMALQERAEDFRRSVKVPSGESAPTLSPKAMRAGKFPLWDASGENLLESNGTGADLGLREDLIDLGEEIIGSPEAGQDMASFRRRWKRYLDSSPPAVLAALMPIPANAGLVGNATKIQAQVGHTGPTMFTLSSGSQLGDVDVDGTNLPAPTANWFAGSPKGAALYGTGVDVSNRISNFQIDGTFRNLKNGGINLEFAEDFDLGRLNFSNIQTDVTYTLCAAVELYQCREFSGGTVRIDGFRKKGVSLNYCTKGTIEKIIGIGGLPADALVHLVGGYLLDLGPVVHDGNGSAGYTFKAWNSRQLNVGMVITRAVQEALQAYGSHVIIAGLDALDHLGSAAQVDAYQARTSPETNAECEFVCNGEFRAVRSVSGSTSQNGLTVRTDPLTGCPINRIKIGSMYVRGHFSAVYCQVGGGVWNSFECGNIDVDAISNSGYLYFGKAKSFKAEFTVGSLVRNGILGFTDADTRGGTFLLTGLPCNDPSSAWTSEPMVRLGYPG